MKNKNFILRLRCACETVPELFAVAGETDDESNDPTFESDGSGSTT